MTTITTTKGRGALVALIVALIGAAFAPAPAGAAIGSELFRFGEHGSGAGQLDSTLGANGGIATDPDTGHIFVTEPGGISVGGESFGNNRISEFTAWGEFVKAWGWGVRDGSPELQTCTEETGCQAGLNGSGAGQMRMPTSIAVDPSGNVFVFESTGEVADPQQNQRIQKFSPAGEFLLMLGGEVNKTTGADICTKADLEAGDVCGAGIEGTGPGEFSRKEGGGSWHDVLDIGPDGLLYIADQKRIQSFNLNGGFEGELSFATIHASNPLFPESPTNPVGNLAIDPLSEDFLIAFVGGCCDHSSAWRVSQSGTVLNPAPLFSIFPSAAEKIYSDALATDSAGNAYVAIQPAGPFGGRDGAPSVLQLDPTGNQAGECCLSPGSQSLGGTSLFALATNTVTAAGGVDLYVAHHVGGFGGAAHPPEDFIEVVGTPPDKWPPPVIPPEVNAQFASSVGGESATLKAEINPNFWEDTTLQLEYGTAPCSAGDCEALPERQLGAGIVKEDVTTDGIVLSGLQPGTTYHYRFSAESSGGGPVFGPDRSFTTYPAPQPTSSACPNQALRTGPSAALADCRAYEMVSPVDKLGADISVFISSNGKPARLDQGSASGEKITYSATAAFGDAPSGPYSSQYLSTREAEGWSTTGISPPRDSGSVLTIFDAFDAQYKAFSEDLSSGWVLQDSDFSLAEESVPGFADLYRRDNLAGTYEALTTATPPEQEPGEFVPKLRGASADGKHAVFTVKDKLTLDALASTSINQLYESFEGQLRLVSIKPNGSPSTEESTTGSYSGAFPDNRGDNVAGAVSDDGRLIYWSERTSAKLYVRVEGAETVAVSGAGQATFWAASPDGKGALYTEADKLRRFDEQTRESTTLVASGVEGVMGASEDLSRIYFVSTSALAAGATAGQPNLYLHEDGEALRFIATLMSNEAPGLNDVSELPAIALSPDSRLSRVTPNGSVALFASRAALTGADNTDLGSGKAAAEVFRYDAEADELTCLSCLPTGARPQAAELEIALEDSSDYLYAASIPGWEMQLHAPRALSDDGDRAYFNSLNRLVLADTNGRQDVYQWEAEGTGECSDTAPGFDPDHNGCVSLVSDGKGPARAEFIDASTDGQDVFFFTETTLLPQDVGQIDVYDARVEGGFPQPPAPAAECEGEACQSPVSPPAEPSYASQGYQGPGNPKPAAKKAKKAKKKSAKAKKKKAKQRKARAKRDRGGRR